MYEIYMSYSRDIIGTFTSVFLWHFMPHCSKVLDGLYMLSDLTEYLVLSGKLRIITFVDML